jgi:predicted cupin superfamily sugar epimerase
MSYTNGLDNPKLYFNTVQYTGNKPTGQSVTGVGFQPDLYWSKNTPNTGYNYALIDSVRGVSKILSSNNNASEITSTDSLTSFDSDGFTLGADANGYVNQNPDNHVAWCWVKSATAGFDIVTATGTGSAKTISHSLSAVPHWIISKEKTGSVNDWVVYHHKNTSAPETDKIILNEANATSDDSCWNDTTPTSSVFSVSGASVVNRNSSTYVYYLWSEKKGFSKFGSYTGNNAAAGPFIYTGFRPAWIMIKDTSAANSWHIRDNKRSTSNPSINFLVPNTTAAEVTAGEKIDLLSNGFKIRQTGGKLNDSGNVYIYMAFAESPFVNSNGVPTNAR